MRLLNIRTLQLEEFFEADVPQYAILSHTWGREEVTFEDIETRANYQQKRGWTKVEGFAKKIRDEGFKYNYIWVDTCCINKSSSAELSESINSMYRWYRNSAVCFVYLADVQGADHRDEDELYEKLHASRWFTRGWTLQELLAPPWIRAYDSKWTLLGEFAKGDIFKDSRIRLYRVIAEITGIPSDCLISVPNAIRQNVAVKMKWAAQRQTTRVEDEAYCLLGLFGVNMPLLYGEGRRAFRRLQEEILRETEDHTILIFMNPSVIESWGCLATRPIDFVHNLGMGDWSSNPGWNGIKRELQLAMWNPSPWSMTSRGLCIDVAFIRLAQFPNVAYVVLPIVGSGIENVQILPLFINGNVGYRNTSMELIGLQPRMLRRFAGVSSCDVGPLYIARNGTSPNVDVARYQPQASWQVKTIILDYSVLPESGYALTEWHPVEAVHKACHIGGAKLQLSGSHSTMLWIFRKDETLSSPSTLMLLCMEKPGKGHICRLFKDANVTGLFSLLHDLDEAEIPDSLLEQDLPGGYYESYESCDRSEDLFDIEVSRGGVRMKVTIRNVREVTESLATQDLVIRR